VCHSTMRVGGRFLRWLGTSIGCPVYDGTSSQGGSHAGSL
jgi:hypothetical protein